MKTKITTISYLGSCMLEVVVGITNKKGKFKKKGTNKKELNKNFIKIRKINKNEQHKC